MGTLEQCEKYFRFVQLSQREEPEQIDSPKKMKYVDSDEELEVKKKEKNYEEDQCDVTEQV
jgi:hypothetical protein